MRVRARAKTCLLLLAAVWVLGGCGDPPTQLDRSEDDHKTKREVRYALFEDPRFREIKVDCTDGVVTLHGRVTSEEARRDAVELAQGFGEVVCRIEVREK